MHYSIIGVYLILSYLSTSNRAKRANVIPITLSLYRSNFRDVIGSLTTLRRLGRGVDIP